MGTITQKWTGPLKKFRQGHLISVKRTLLKQEVEFTGFVFSQNKQKSYPLCNSSFQVAASVPQNNQRKQIHSQQIQHILLDMLSLSIPEDLCSSLPIGTLLH